MPRKPIIRSREHYYHLTGRSNNKDFWYLPIASVWKVMCEELRLLQIAYSIEIANFVLMSNHFHLILRTQNLDIDRLMYEFMKNTTLKIQKLSGRINRIYGGRYKGCLLDNNKYIMNAYKYVYLNPVEANIVTEPDEYLYSTLIYKIARRAPFGIELDDKFLAMPICVEIDWLRSSFTSLEKESLRQGLQKSQFRWKKERSSGKEIKPDYFPCDAMFT